MPVGLALLFLTQLEFEMNEVSTWDTIFRLVLFITTSSPIIIDFIGKSVISALTVLAQNTDIGWTKLLVWYL